MLPPRTLPPQAAQGLPAGGPVAAPAVPAARPEATAAGSAAAGPGERRPPQTRLELAPPGTRLDVAARNGAVFAGPGQAPEPEAMSAGAEGQEAGHLGWFGGALRLMGFDPVGNVGHEQLLESTATETGQQATATAAATAAAMHMPQSGGQEAAPPPLRPQHDAQALAEQLLALGFSEREAVEASKRTSSVEAAVEWIVQGGA